MRALSRGVDTGPKKSIMGQRMGGVMMQVRGVLERVGSKQYDDKVRYWCKIGDTYYSTFDTEIGKKLEEGVEFIIEYTVKGSFNNIVDARTPEEMEELKRATATPKSPTSPEDIADEAMRLLARLVELVNTYKEG